MSLSSHCGYKTVTFSVYTMQSTTSELEENERKGRDTLEVYKVLHNCSYHHKHNTSAKPQAKTFVSDPSTSGT
jgi:hypothetical protein